jgi:hypothetical protein
VDQLGTIPTGSCGREGNSLSLGVSNITGEIFLVTCDFV